MINNLQFLAKYGNSEHHEKILNHITTTDDHTIHDENDVLSSLAEHGNDDIKHSVWLAADTDNHKDTIKNLLKHGNDQLRDQIIDHYTPDDVKDEHYMDHGHHQRTDGGILRSMVRHGNDDQVKKIVKWGRHHWANRVLDGDERIRYNKLNSDKL